MNVKALIPLVAGLGIGGLALKVGIDTVRTARGAQQPVAKTQVWAALSDIPRGTEITAEMLTAMPYPSGSLPEGVFEDQEELVGRVPRLVSPAGLPIMETMLAPPGTKAGIHVPEGYRAVAVKIDASSGVDYHLEPGAFVDVIGSFKVRRDDRQETIAKTIIENAEVAAVGQRVSPSSGEEEEGKNLARTVRAVTLFVKPDQVKTLHLAEQKGKIKLSLRGEMDLEDVNDESMISDFELTGGVHSSTDNEGPGLAGFLEGLFAGQPTVVAAAPEVALPWVITVYRGNDAERVGFKNSTSNERMSAAELTELSRDSAENGDRNSGRGSVGGQRTERRPRAAATYPASGSEMEPEEPSE